MVNEQLTTPHTLLAVMVTVVTPTLKARPLPLPLPLPVVAPLRLYVSAGAGLPVTVVVYVTTVEQVPTTLGTVMLPGQLIVGILLMIKIAVIDGPGQPLAIGVMV